MTFSKKTFPKVKLKLLLESGYDFVSTSLLNQCYFPYLNRTYQTKKSSNLKVACNPRTMINFYFLFWKVLSSKIWKHLKMQYVLHTSVS